MIHCLGVMLDKVGLAEAGWSRMASHIWWLAQSQLGLREQLDHMSLLVQQAGSGSCTWPWSQGSQVWPDSALCAFTCQASTWGILAKARQSRDSMGRHYQRHGWIREAESWSHFCNQLLVFSPFHPRCLLLTPSPPSIYSWPEIYSLKRTLSPTCVMNMQRFLVSLVNKVLSCVRG